MKAAQYENLSAYEALRLFATHDGSSSAYALEHGATIDHDWDDEGSSLVMFDDASSLLIDGSTVEVRDEQATRDALKREFAALLEQP